MLLLVCILHMTSSATSVNVIVLWNSLNKFDNSTHAACDVMGADYNICNAILNDYHVAYQSPGSLLLGGLFPVHQGQACSVLEDMGTIQRMEAMPYAVQEVNKMNILKNLTLGYSITDTCNQETITLARTLEYLPACGDCDHYPICLPDCPVKYLGVVGPESSSNTLVAAHASNLALTTVISYFATSAELQDKQTFPTLHTTVPSDDYQVEAMLDLLDHFGWTYFSLVHSDDRYGRDAAEYMQSNLHPGMCTAIVTQVSKKGTNSSYDAVVKSLQSVQPYTNATVVIVFTDGVSANRLFEAVSRAGAVGEFVWVGSEGWGISTNDVTDQVSVAQGAITFAPHTEFNPGFEEYFQSLGPDHDSNPWWKEIWADYFGCSWEVDSNLTSSCYQYDHIDDANGFVPDSTVSLVISAVEAFARALSHYLNDTYPEVDDLSTWDNLYISPWKVSEYVSILPFPGEVLERSGNQWQHSSAVYDIRNLQELSDGSYDYVYIGSWKSSVNLHNAPTSGILSINDSAIQWPGCSTEIPSSFCSAPCPVGEIKIFVTSSCCWNCAACGDEYIVTHDGTICQKCAAGDWPDDARENCDKIVPTYLKWDSPGSIILLLLALSNLVMTKLCIVFFFRHRDDKLIKASGIELMSVIMFGIVLQNILVFILLSHPSTETCSITRLVFGLDFTITYSPVLLKSNRLYRIFHTAKHSARRPKWIRPKEQLIIVAIIILIQVIITVVLGAIFPPEVTTCQPNPWTVELTCALYDVTILVPLTYNILIALACLYYSWKTRKLPNNYKESRFIVMAVCCYLMLWIAFIPTYLVVASVSGASSSVGVYMLATVEIISSFITLVALFFPRIYAVKYVPATSWHVVNPSFHDVTVNNKVGHCDDNSIVNTTT